MRNALCRLNRLPMKQRRRRRRRRRRAHAFQSLVQKRWWRRFVRGKEKQLETLSLFGGTKGRACGRAERILARKISRLVLPRPRRRIVRKYYELLLFLSDARPQYFFFVFVDINARRRRGIDGRRFDKSFRFPQPRSMDFRDWLSVERFVLAIVRDERKLSSFGIKDAEPDLPLTFPWRRL